MKVKFFDQKLRKSFAAIISAVSVVTSLALIFFSIPETTDFFMRLELSGAFLFILFVVYIVMWLNANRRKKVTLTINGTEIIIQTGDIFAKNDSLKVIPFNEYFDTQVDEIIISSRTLHGQYIQSHMNRTASLLNHMITTDTRLQQLAVSADAKKDANKKNRYPLGTIFKDDDYLLLAFSKFDENNRAFHDNKSLWECLMNMWNEVDIHHEGRSLCLPLLGSGITRYKGMEVTEQELLELLLVSFKLSGFGLNWNAQISIIIYPPNADKINFYNLSHLSE